MKQEKLKDLTDTLELIKINLDKACEEYLEQLKRSEKLESVVHDSRLQFREKTISYLSAYKNETAVFPEGGVKVNCYLPGRLMLITVNIPAEKIPFTHGTSHLIKMDDEGQAAELAQWVIKGWARLRAFYAKMRRLGFAENIEAGAFELNLTPWGRKRFKFLRSWPNEIKLMTYEEDTKRYNVIGCMDRISNFELAAARLVHQNLSAIRGLNDDTGQVFAHFPDWLRAELVELKR